MKNRDALQNQVVVITGASSGIGRATAVAFATRGAHVVLAARRERALRIVAAECERLGVSALVVPTEINDSAAVEKLAQAAIDHFGQIDIWINNAGVGLFGPFVGTDVKTHRRVVETNLFGTMNGAAAVLPHFIQQRRGLLITNISIGGLAPVPYASAYAASKFGMRGFLASLRQELTPWKAIHVCAVFPASIDTPGYQHGANVSGTELRPGPPLFPPEDVAKAMVSLALRPRDEVTVGWPASLAKVAYAAAPALTERLAGSAIRSRLRQASPDSSAPHTQGNLFLPVSAGTSVSGGWTSPRKSAPPWLRLTLGSLLGIGAAFLIGEALRPRGGQASPA